MWLKTHTFGYNLICEKERQHDNINPIHCQKWGNYPTFGNESASFKGINLKSNRDGQPNEIASDQPDCK